MANIFARSPYLIRIAESGQNGSKVELFLSATTFSGSPQYTLSKLIPASNDVETLYDISPYIREYISFPTQTNVVAATTNPTNERVNVRVKRYKLVGSTYTLLDTTDYKAFDGYTYYQESYNFDAGDYGLEDGNYYYWESDGYAGQIRAITGASFTAKYTSFHASPTITSVAISSGTYDIARVLSANLSVGNKVEITVKISQSGLNDIIQTFRRYEYEIISEHQDDSYLNSLKERSDYLDKYLNI